MNMFFLKDKYHMSELGNKVNHCPNLDKENVQIIEKEDGWYLHSKRSIHPGDELLANYHENRPFFIKPADNTWTC